MFRRLGTYEHPLGFGNLKVGVKRNLFQLDVGGCFTLNKCGSWLVLYRSNRIYKSNLFLTDLKVSVLKDVKSHLISINCVLILYLTNHLNYATSEVF